MLNLGIRLLTSYRLLTVPCRALISLHLSSTLIAFQNAKVLLIHTRWIAVVFALVSFGSRPKRCLVSLVEKNCS